MTALFLGFLVVMAAVVVGLIGRYLGVRPAGAILAGLTIWFLYIGGMAWFGIFRNFTIRPPGAAFLFIPVLIFLVIFIVRAGSAGGERVAMAFPLWILLGTQSFRIVVELFLHQLWHAGLIPRMLTFSGANVDIYVGASAPLIAWLATRGRLGWLGWLGARVALVWNVVGLLSLANIVTRAVLTVPGPLNLIHSEVPNLMIGTFPFMIIPGFFVPLAVVLHVLAMRALRSSATSRTPGIPSRIRSQLVQ
jgi:hypothetical protein